MPRMYAFSTTLTIRLDSPCNFMPIVVEYVWPVMRWFGRRIIEFNVLIDTPSCLVTPLSSKHHVSDLEDKNSCNLSGGVNFCYYIDQVEIGVMKTTL